MSADGSLSPPKEAERKGEGRGQFLTLHRGMRTKVESLEATLLRMRMRRRVMRLSIHEAENA